MITRRAGVYIGSLSAANYITVVIKIDGSLIAAAVITHAAGLDYMNFSF